MRFRPPSFRLDSVRGVHWQRWARGEEIRPLVPAGVAEQFEASLDLEWPIDGLEPLSFVLARLLDPLCERLERSDRGAVVLRVTLMLVTSASARSEGGRERHERVVELPAPMRDARVLRTLALLDLESNPPPAAIRSSDGGGRRQKGVCAAVRVCLRALLPSDKLATLLARWARSMGSDGSSLRRGGYISSGAFAMANSITAHLLLIPSPPARLNRYAYGGLPPASFGIQTTMRGRAEAAKCGKPLAEAGPIPITSRVSVEALRSRFQRGLSRSNTAAPSVSRRIAAALPAAASSAARVPGAHPAIGGKTCGIVMSGTCR